MYLDKDHMRPIDELIEEAREKAKETWEKEEYINLFVYRNLSYIIKDFQKFVTDLQEQVKPQ